MTRESDIRDARVPWDESFMDIARVMARRGTCDRLRVGAVITVGNRLISTGYNGAPTNWDDCDLQGHEMVKIGDRESCVRTLHAEENAILQCALYEISPEGGTLYTTASTCYECLKKAAQVKIKRIVYCAEYTGGRNSGQLTVKELASKYGIYMEKL